MTPPPPKEHIVVSFPPYTSGIVLCGLLSLYVSTPTLNMLFGTVTPSPKFPDGSIIILLSPLVTNINLFSSASGADSALIYVLLSTSLTPSREIHFEPLQPSNLLLSLLYLTAPLFVVGSAVVPTGNTIELDELNFVIDVPLPILIFFEDTSKKISLSSSLPPNKLPLISK